MDQNNTTEQAAAPAGSPAPRAMSRRRFASAGLGGAGALLTIVSAPSMAASLTCASPSGTLSGDLYNSRETAADVICGGRSHGYYKNHLAEWKQYQDVMFGAEGMFYCTGKNKAPAAELAKPRNKQKRYYSNTTLLEFMKRQEFDPHNFGMQLTTVWLNIKLGRINFLTMGDLQTIWNEWQLTGYYEPSAGMPKWNTPKIVAYLQRTYS